jgi:hypothetical protein
MAKSKAKKHGSGKQYRPKPVKYDPKYTREFRDGLREKIRDNFTAAEVMEMERQIQVAVEKAEQTAVIETHNRTWAIVFRVLHDRFGFETEQKRLLYDTAVEYLEDIRDGRLSAQELLDTLEHQDGIRMITTWADLE